MFYQLGAKVFGFFYEIGSLGVFTRHIFLLIVKGKINIKNTIEQMINLGVKSLPITLVTATFVGMVFAVQVIKEFLNFGAGKMIGGIIGLAVWRELSPMIIGVVIAGRVGAAISAEIGTMKVTEQVEALEALSQDPIEYLIVPRFLAMTIMLPLLVGIADIMGFLGGFLISLSTRRINPVAFFHSAQTMLDPIDIWGGLLKALFFGMMIALIACYMGMKAKAGAKGVGEITTQAVVISLYSIFIVNYFLSVLIY